MEESGPFFGVLSYKIHIKNRVCGVFHVKTITVHSALTNGIQEVQKRALVYSPTVT